MKILRVKSFCWLLDCVSFLGPVKSRNWKLLEDIFFWENDECFNQVGSVQVVGATNCCSYFCTMMAPVLSPLIEPRSLLWRLSPNQNIDHKSPLILFEFALEFALKLWLQLNSVLYLDFDLWLQYASFDFVLEFIYWLQYVFWSWPWLWLVIAVCLLILILTLSQSSSFDCSMSLDRATPTHFSSSPLLEDPYESIFVEVTIILMCTLINNDFSVKTRKSWK